MSLAKLKILITSLCGNCNVSSNPENEDFYDTIYHLDSWFTPLNIEYSIRAFCNFFSSFKEPVHFRNINSKSIFLIADGLFPFEGLPEIVNCLSSGCSVILKTSKANEALLKLIFEPTIFKGLTFHSEPGVKTDGIIFISGNNQVYNNIKYFFSESLNLHLNRNFSPEIILGNESADEINNIGIRVFTFFGRTVFNSKSIHFKNNIKPDFLFDSWMQFSYLLKHHKYINLYEYNKTILLFNSIEHYDNGFCLFVNSRPGLFTALPVIEIELTAFNPSSNFGNISDELFSREIESEYQSEYQWFMKPISENWEQTSAFLKNL